MHVNECSSRSTLFINIQHIIYTILRLNETFHGTCIMYTIVRNLLRMLIFDSRQNYFHLGMGFRSVQIKVISFDIGHSDTIPEESILSGPEKHLMRQLLRPRVFCVL